MTRTRAEIRLERGGELAAVAARLRLDEQRRLTGDAQDVVERQPSEVREVVLVRDDVRRRREMASQRRLVVTPMRDDLYTWFSQTL
jgi:hypothetical protein